MPKFSIIMCTWNRANILPKTITSVLNQTFADFELLIMDDGSTDNTQEVLQKFAAQDSRIRLFKHEKSRERIISRHELMKECKGEWVYWVDSDDEIMYGTLEVLKHNIELYPDYKIFNFGQIILSLTGTDLKVARELPDWDREGMDHFDSGLVGAGGFVFKREITPDLPDVDNCFDFADWFGIQVDEWFDKNRPGEEHQLYAHTDRDGREARWCGNPWGDDYVFVWLLTRKNKSKKLTVNLYIAYIRTENWAYEFSDGSGTMGGSTKGV